MASSFSTLGIELIATGEASGLWGDKTNVNLQMFQEITSGYVAQSIAGSAQTTALSITNATTGDTARQMIIEFTGTISGNQIVTIPDSLEKMYLVKNSTSGAHTVQFKTASGTGVTFGASDKGTKLVFANGTNVVDAGLGGGIDLNGEELILDEDADTSITADTDDQIDIKIAGADDFRFTANTFTALSGSNFAGALTGNVTGNASGTAATVTGAAQSNITSLGTLTTLTVDNIIVNGSTIGHTSDTDLITLADGIATVAGEVSMTTLDIGGTNVTSTAAEINLIDGGATVGTTAIADGDGLLINDAGTMRVSTVQTLAAYLDDEITAMPNLVSTGALNSGSITSGFGTIDTGSSTITTTGLISGGSLDIDNVLINGTTIGHTDDTDLITLADGIATVAGEISVTTLDIGGTNVTATATELNIIDGNATIGTTAVADGDGIVTNDGGTMRQTTVQTFATYFGSEITAMSNLVTTGALGSGSIAAGFGAIDNGTSGIRTNTFTAETSFVPDAQDGAALGTTSLQFSDLFLADGAVIGMGDDNEVTLTHVADTGILLNSDNVIQLRDSAINIGSPADGDLDINADDEVEINSTLIDINGNVEMSGTLAQAGVASFAKAANVAQVALSSSSNAVAWDASAAPNAFHLTTENTTFSAPSNNVEGAFIALEINYNGTHTIAFNTIFEFAASTAPTFTSTDAKTDILVFRYNGAVWQEVGRTLNLSES